ncbi:MAG: hypothetical protein GY702_07495 [Desulfobulbaceae bacterium]|nr:hypothetical protein [Desulfobulbaceae bacterium]
MLKIVSGLCFFVILCSSNVASFGATPEKKPQNWGVEQGGDIPLLIDSHEQALDDAQAEASEILLQTARWIDSFFDDERFVSEDNESRASLKLSLGYSKNDEFEVKPRMDIRMKLPKLSSRAQLIITASDDTDFDIENEPGSIRPGDDENEKNDITAALRFFLKESEKYNIVFDTGVSWSYLYGSIRYRAIQDFDQWLGRFTNRLRWYTDDGWENKVTYDLETHFRENLFFRSSTSANFYETEDGLLHSQYFTLYQVLGSMRVVTYEAGVYFDTEPSYRMTDTLVLLKYRQRFYRDWLVLEISPRVSFPEDHNRDANPGIIFKFEAAIGYDADEQGYKNIFH